MAGQFDQTIALRKKDAVSKVGGGAYYAMFGEAMRMMHREMGIDVAGAGEYDLFDAMMAKGEPKELVHRKARLRMLVDSFAVSHAAAAGVDDAKLSGAIDALFRRELHQMGVAPEDKVFRQMGLAPFPDDGAKEDDGEYDILAAVLDGASVAMLEELLRKAQGDDGA